MKKFLGYTIKRILVDVLDFTGIYRKNSVLLKHPLKRLDCSFTYNTYIYRGYRVQAYCSWEFKDVPGNLRGVPGQLSFRVVLVSLTALQGVSGAFTWLLERSRSFRDDLGSFRGLQGFQEVSGVF